MNMNVLVFDIETVPNTALGRRLLNIGGTDAEVAQAMFNLRREKTNSDFLSSEQHKIVAISVVFRMEQNKLNVWSLGDPGSTEKDLIERFFGAIDHFTPDLVSWNGAGFDLPVLHYRALRHSIPSTRYWYTGDKDNQEFRWNNYLSRYHSRHTDLMDVISSYQNRARAPLDAVARSLGLPGKMDMHGDAVWEKFQAGKIVEIRNYCETDVINTYLVYLRFQLIRGYLSAEQHQRELQLMCNFLTSSGQPHFRQYYDRWCETAQEAN